MKRTHRWKTTSLVALASLVIASAPLQAATNTATGDIAGVGADLDDSNTFTLNTQTLALIKRAFLSDGTALTSGATVPRGTTVKFLIYLNNNTAFAVNDVSVQDVLAASFAYQTGTIRVDNTVVNCAAAICTALEEGNIYTAVNGAAVRTDAVDADVVSYAAGTIDAGNATILTQGAVNASANKVWAMIFTVVMQ